MKALRTIIIQVASKGLTEKIPVVQSDSGRSIDFVISDMTIPSGATAKFYALKPDTAKVYSACTISGNTITVNLATQTLAVTGIVRCQVQILSGSDTVTSFEFALDVEPSIIDSSAIASTNEFSALTAALQQVNSLVTGVKGNAETAYRTGQINLTLANLGYAVANNLTTTDSGYLLDARALKTLVDRLTNEEVTLTIASGFTAQSDFSNRATYNPATKTAIINFVITGTIPAATHTQVCSIPTAYAPPKTVITAGSCGTSGWMQVQVTNEGKVLCWHPTGATSPRGVVTYVLD